MYIIYIKIWRKF